MVVKYFAIFQTKAANRIALLLLLDLAILREIVTTLRLRFAIFRPFSSTSTTSEFGDNLLIR